MDGLLDAKPNLFNYTHILHPSKNMMEYWGKIGEKNERHFHLKSKRWVR